MSFIPRLRTVVYAVAITGPPFLYGRSAIRQLEEKYPALSPGDASTLALRTCRDSDRHIPYVDVFGARVPITGLPLNSPDKDLAQPCLEELWARAFFNSKAVQLEGRIVGGGRLSATDLGGEGFQLGAYLLAGLMRIVRPPTVGTPLLVEWRMPAHLVGFFERIARWGYPWRLMDGGMHEWSVGRVYGDEESLEVEVRFASAHIYKIVEEEGESRKVIPRWVQRLHRAYARFLLDRAVDEVRQRANSRPHFGVSN